MTSKTNTLFKLSRLLGPLPKWCQVLLLLVKGVGVVIVVGMGVEVVIVVVIVVVVEDGLPLLVVFKVDLAVVS